MAEVDGTPVFSHDGIICTGESYKNVVKLYLRQGRVPEGSGLNSLLTSSSLDGTYAAQSTSTKEKAINPPSRRFVHQAVALNSSGKSKQLKKAKS